MILSLNSFIWDALCTDSTFSDRYSALRTQFGAGFIPFIPVDDNNAGGIPWGDVPYIIYQDLPNVSRRIINEQNTRVLYTIVGNLADILYIRDAIVSMFSVWNNPFSITGYKINEISAVQSSRILPRDYNRELYSLTLTLTVNYFSC